MNTFATLVLGTLTVLGVFTSLVLGGCSSSIGDSCSSSLDCSQAGTRICDQSSPGGYCTAGGCDVGTCPDSATCVQFFSVINVDKTCATQADCTLDEICTVGGQCAPRSSETRFCMASCSGQSDCRDNYECRTLDRMKIHGGQPVRRDGQTDDDLHPYCAPDATCALDDQTCQFGDTCDLAAGRCKP